MAKLLQASHFLGVEASEGIPALPCVSMEIPENFTKDKALKYKSLLSEEFDFIEYLTNRNMYCSRSGKLIKEEVEDYECSVLPIMYIFKSNSTIMLKIAVGSYLDRIEKISGISLSCIRCCCCKMSQEDRAKLEQVPFAAVIAQTSIFIAVTILFTTVPLFLFSSNNVTATQIFSILNGECQQASAGQASNSTFTPQSLHFNDTCAASTTPIAFDEYNDYPKDTPLYFDAGNECTGMFPEIKQMPKNFQYCNFLQYICYYMFYIYGCIILARDVFKKRNISISLLMNSIYCTKAPDRWPCGTGFFTACCAYFTRNNFFKYSSITGDGIIIILMILLFLISLSVPFKSVQQWCIFNDQELKTNPAVMDFKCDYSGVDSSAYISHNFGVKGCSAVLPKFAYQIQYEFHNNNDFSSIFFPAAYFIFNVFSLALVQQSKYDWIDVDKLLDSDKKSDTPYYDISNFRNRYISDIIIKDWYAIHVFYPVFLKIYVNEGGKFNVVHDKLGAETLNKLRQCLVSIHKKAVYCNQSMKDLVNSDRKVITVSPI